MPLARSLAETDHVLGHELMRAFPFDITSGAGLQSGRSGDPAAACASSRAWPNISLHPAYGPSHGNVDA